MNSSESSRKWRENNPEKILAYREKQLENQKRWRKAHPDKVLENARKYYKQRNEKRTKSGYFRSQKYRDMKKKCGWNTYRKRVKSITNYVKNNPEQIKARHAVWIALVNGEITKPDTCKYHNDECSGIIHAHHHKGYKKENYLTITWLCNEHHRRQHFEPPR